MAAKRKTIATIKIEILFIHEFKQNSNYHLQLVLESHNIKMYWSSNLSTFHQRASGGEN